MTLVSPETPSLAPTEWQAEGDRIAEPERAGYGQCIICGCGSYLDSGTGDCTCGHSYGQHYS